MDTVNSNILAVNLTTTYLMVKLARIFEWILELTGARKARRSKVEVQFKSTATEFVPKSAEFSKAIEIRPVTDVPSRAIEIRPPESKSKKDEKGPKGPVEFIPKGPAEFTPNDGPMEFIPADEFIPGNAEFSPQYYQDQYDGFVPMPMPVPMPYAAYSGSPQPYYYNGSPTLGMGNLTMDDSLASYYQQSHLLTPSGPLQPIEYHLYNTVPHLDKFAEGMKPAHHYFISDKLREEFQRKSEAAHQVLDPNDPKASKMPSEVHVYHSLVPLEKAKDSVSKVFGYPSTVYKAIRSTDGKVYFLRRIEGFRLVNEEAMMCIEAWRQVHHGCVVSLLEAFTTRAFGDYSLVFAYDYHPLAGTLTATHLSEDASHGIEEPLLWSYICQIATALKAIHGQNLAARVIEPSKIILSGKNRIRLSCCGILDLLTFDTKANVSHLQQDDLLNFGQLIIALACGSLNSLQNLQKSIDYLARFYHPDVKNVVLYLLSKPSSYKTIEDVIGMISGRLVDQLSSSFTQNDVLENELAKSLENGRLARLVFKLGFINERPEFDLDVSWSETGDRYLLKLFRDYVFHQVDETGAPLVDLAHVVLTLNKLDAGIPEKIMLTSRDDRSCLIVSFAELKKCVDSTFKELIARSNKS